MLSTLINRPCVITRRLSTGSEDDYGNLIPDESTIETVCELQQKQRTEPAGQGELSDTQWTLFLLPGDTLRTGDVVTVDDEDYEVVGEPWQARNPRTQLLSHVEATLRRTASTGDEVGS